MSTIGHHDQSPTRPAAPVYLLGAARTERGCERPVNEDAVVAHQLLTLGDGRISWRRRLDADQQGDLVLVLDGMGGYRGGAVASRLAGTLTGLGLARCTSDADLLAVLESTNETVLGSASGVDELDGMGCTVVGLLLNHDGYTVFNVGDSRAFVFGDSTLGQLSVDDRRLVEGGSVLTQAIGRRRLDLDPHLLHREYLPWQRFLLCSDGLHDYVDLATIKQILNAPLVEAAADALVDAALDAGAPDNVSVAVVEISAGSRI